MFGYATEVPLSNAVSLFSLAFLVLFSIEKYEISHTVTSHTTLIFSLDIYTVSLLAMFVYLISVFKIPVL